jgi:hypothetical protein
MHTDSQCANNRYASGNLLEGALPTEWSTLDHLQVMYELLSLSLSLSLSVCVCVCHLYTLTPNRLIQIRSLNNNQLNSTIPDQWSTMTDLVVLYVAILHITHQV